MTHHCFVCERPARDWCSRCKSLYYCSHVCQKLNWPQHKTDCSQIGIGETVYKFLFGYIGADMAAMMARYGDIHLSIGENWQDVIAARDKPHFVTIVGDGRGPTNINVCRMSFNDIQLRRFEAKIERDIGNVSKDKIVNVDTREKVVYFET